MGYTKRKFEWPPAGHLSMRSGGYGCQSTSLMEVYHWSEGEAQFSSQSWDLEGGGQMPPIPTIDGSEVAVRGVNAPNQSPGREGEGMGWGCSDVVNVLLADSSFYLFLWFVFANIMLITNNWFSGACVISQPCPGSNKVVSIFPISSQSDVPILRKL